MFYRFILISIQVQSRKTRFQRWHMQSVCGPLCFLCVVSRFTCPYLPEALPAQTEERLVHLRTAEETPAPLNSLPAVLLRLLLRAADLLPPDLQTPAMVSASAAVILTSILSSEEMKSGLLSLQTTRMAAPTSTKLFF